MKMLAMIWLIDEYRHVHSTQNFERTRNNNNNDNRKSKEIMKKFSTDKWFAIY